MILRTLTTDNFRNLAPREVGFHPSVNILLGRNGQGKTNLLEAIHFVATTKSFRTSRSASLFRFGAASVYAAATVERGGLLRTHSAGLEAGESRRRVLMINGEKVTLTAYLNALAVFAYSQARLATIGGPPEERRRFLDRGIASIHPAYLDELTRYLRILKQRNALLHAIAKGESPSSTLDAWTDEFVTAAAAIHRARSAYAAEVAARVASIVAEYAYHVDRLEIVYRGSGEEAELREHLGRIRRHEIRAGMSLTGPQRDAIELVVDGRHAADVLSGGEQKMIVLFLEFAKLALFRERFDEPPLFLLDDIDAELDIGILQQLLIRLPSRTQVFATSAKESFLEALEAGPHRRLNVENGAVAAMNDFS